MPKGYHHLTYAQRCQVFALKSNEESVQQIASTVSVSQSAIYRELDRNKDDSGYHYNPAHAKALDRRSRASNRAKKMTPELIAVIEEKLRLQWSPEQISGWMKKHGKGDISHESIYKHIRRDKEAGGELYLELRHRGKKYNKRGTGKAGRGCIPGRVDIAERPLVVEEKSRIGDWEIDTMIGRAHKGVIVSMVERRSKLTLLKKVGRKTAQEVKMGLTSRLGEVKENVLTITADNGKEFSNHVEIGRELDAGVFFARPYHSWERGLNEHTNGLVRQYLPKYERIDLVPDEIVALVEERLNNRPRKVLNFQTPLEVFYGSQVGATVVALQS